MVRILHALEKLFGALEAGFPYRPDLTVCSSQQDNGRPGAYTLTFAPADLGSEQIGTYFSYYFNPAVLTPRDLARVLPGPIPFAIPPGSVPAGPLPDIF